MKATRIALFALFVLFASSAVLANTAPLHSPPGEAPLTVRPGRDTVFHYLQEPDLLMIYGMSSGFDAEIADDIPAEFAGVEIVRLTLWLGQWFAGGSSAWPDPVGVRTNFYHEYCPPELDPFRTVEVAWDDLEKTLVYNGSSRRVFEIVVELDPPLVLEEGMSLGGTALIDWGSAEPFAGLCATPYHVSYGACPAYLDGDNWGYTRWTAIDNFTMIPQDLGYAIESTPTTAPEAPASKVALAASPNPFNPSTTLRGELTVGGTVNLQVVDVAGRRVATLLAGWREAGELTVDWNGRDDLGHRLASGVYTAILSGPDGIERSKLVLIK